MGSTIRASTSALNASSPRASNPSLVYALVSTCHNTALDLGGDHRLPRRHRARAQVELALTRVDLRPGRLQQRGQLRLGVRRAQVLQDLVPPAAALSDLHGRRSRRGPDLAHEHHDPTLPTRLVCHRPWP